MNQSQPRLQPKLSQRNRTQRAQSMVEYALGFGCVIALAMVAFNCVGPIGDGMVASAQSAIHYGGARTPVKTYQRRALSEPTSQ